jgi:hypothetical protein
MREPYPANHPHDAETLLTFYADFPWQSTHIILKKNG